MENFCPIAEHFKDASAIKIFSSGKEWLYERNTPSFGAVLEGANQLFADGIQMPAFGVSMDKLTREELKSGLWVEFCFSEEKHCMNMPFESLLFAVRAEYKGFNIVRKTEGLYQGRCYYVDLRDKDMAELFQSLERVIGR